MHAIIDQKAVKWEIVHKWKHPSPMDEILFIQMEHAVQLFSYGAFHRPDQGVEDSVVALRDSLKKGGANFGECCFVQQALWLGRGPILSFSRRTLEGLSSCCAAECNDIQSTKLIAIANQ